jgi:hypothetical protein
VKTDQIAPLYADPGPFASAYVEVSRDLQDGDHVAGLQARAAADQLKEQGAPDEVVAMVKERLDQPPHLPAPVSRFVVATSKGVLLDELTPRHRPRPEASWAALPDLAAWLADTDTAVPFVLALVDHEGGDVRRYAADAVGPEEGRSLGGDTEFEHKIRGGGWAHLRFQHHVENVWRRNATEVVAEIDRLVRDHDVALVVLAGDPQSRQQVLATLPDIDAEVVELDAGGRNADSGEDALEQAVEQALRDEVVQEKLSQVHELRDRMGRDYAVATGIGDVVEAFVRGQVDRLLIDPGAAAGFTVEPERYPGLALGAATDLPASLPADRVLVAAAALTDADVVVSRASTLGGAPAAALLRWDQTSRGASA